MVFLLRELLYFLFGYESINKGFNAKANITNNYNEWLTYDANGNILSLGRNGISDSHNNLIQIDKLEYHYKNNNSNILIGVNDLSGNTAGFKKDQITNISESNPDYFYDNNGNLQTDKNKGIEKIIYNHLNLPTNIFFKAQTNLLSIFIPPQAKKYRAER